MLNLTFLQAWRSLELISVFFLFECIFACQIIRPLCLRSLCTFQLLNLCLFFALTALTLPLPGSSLRHSKLLPKPALLRLLLPKSAQRNLLMHSDNTSCRVLDSVGPLTFNKPKIKAQPWLNVYSRRGNGEKRGINGDVGSSGLYTYFSLLVIYVF